MTLSPFTLLPAYRFAHATASLIVHQTVVATIAVAGATITVLTGGAKK